MNYLTKLLRFFLVAITIFLAQSLHSQTIEKKTNNILKIESGFLYDSYNSLGPRLKIEVLQVMDTRWTYGIAFDSKWHLFHITNDQRVEFPANSNSLSGNVYYCLNPINKGTSFEVGAGLGGIHLYWDQSHRWGPMVNISFNANMKVSEKLTLFTSPLFILLPISEFSYSLISRDNKGGYFSFSVLPLGIRIML